MCLTAWGKKGLLKYLGVAFHIPHQGKAKGGNQEAQEGWGTDCQFLFSPEPPWIGLLVRLKKCQTAKMSVLSLKRALWKNSQPIRSAA